MDFRTLFRLGSILTGLLAFPAVGDVLHIRIPSPPMTLDWTGQVTTNDAPLVVNLCEGLFGYEYPSEKLIPAIAATLKKSKDLKEYVFQIRADAKWSDGRSIYAKDFVDGWQRILSPQGTSIYSYYLFDIVNAREYSSKKIASFDDVGIKATNDRTLVVKFKHPQKNWEVTTAFWPLYPVRKDLIEKFGNNWWRAGTLVSSGPFVFDSYEPGKKATLKRNPHYRKTASNVSEVDVNFLVDQNEALKKFEAGQFSFLTNIQPEKYATDKRYHSIPLLRHYALAINSERFPFNNRYFRLAVLSSVDRTKLVPTEYNHFPPATSLIPSSLFPGSEDLTVPHNVEKAKEYLRLSGFVKSKGFKIAFLTSLEEPFKEMSKRVASQIESALGIPVSTLTYQNQEFETFSNLGEYNMVMLSWTAKVRSPEDFLFPYSSGYSVHSRTRYLDEDYDDAIARQDFKKAQLIIGKEKAVVHPLVFEKAGSLARPNVKKLYFDHRGLPVLKDVVVD